MKILRTNHMIQYFLSEPIKMHPKKGEETEMTLLPISRFYISKNELIKRNYNFSLLFFPSNKKKVIYIYIYT